ncbi:MAG: hypothetical protein D6780_01830 [Candidatus Dadabacteria bacterium]|nr:MAG: hypothetical protein D6780_01830 [Candidatus Dadabacteria bacterium]
MKNKKDFSTPPEHSIAVALGYDELKDEAPILLAKGQQRLADEIVRIARKYGVPVVQRDALAKMLNRSEVNEEIPVELFEVVAYLLAEIELESQTKAHKNKASQNKESL